MLSAALLALSCEPGVPEGRVQVLGSLPHDSTAYTQGLVYRDGVLFESTGRYGGSTVRRLDAATGRVLAVDSLGEELFGEGLEMVGERLLQLTWKENVALLWNPETLTPLDTLELPGRGWGLCGDEDGVYVTAGGSILYRRDPATLETLEEIQVTRDGAPLWEVNELECVGDRIYANVYRSDRLVRIDPATGRVDAEWDVAGLVPTRLRGSPDAVANGIAHDPGSDTFYLTGKLWPVLYRVRLLTPGAPPPS